MKAVCLLNCSPQEPALRKRQTNEATSATTILNVQFWLDIYAQRTLESDAKQKIEQQHKCSPLSTMDVRSSEVKTSSTKLGKEGVVGCDLDGKTPTKVPGCHFRK